MTRNESGKIKKSRKTQNDEERPEKLTKEETQVARYLRLKCPCKQGNLNGLKVDFFIASKFVDCLMESKFGPGTLEDPPKGTAYNENAKKTLFDSRHACFKYMQQLMNKGLFARAVKIYKEASVESNEETPNLRKRKIKDYTKDESVCEPTPNNSDKSPSPDEKKDTKKKFKLEIHETQRFVDEPEPYVWYYETTSTMSSIIGALLILGSIAVCCFPLWPSSMREGVYYLSLAGCAFLGSILGLAVLKYILYAFLWIVSLGTLEFWMFPNLTEDVGFFESFVPVYKIKWHKKNQTATKANTNNTNLESEITTPTKKSEVLITEEAEKKSPKQKSTVRARMQDLTESTVEISTIRSGENEMEKVPEDYDFELVDDTDQVQDLVQ